MTQHEKLLAYGSWLAVCIFWGTTYFAIRVGIESLPPVLFAGVRFLTAGTILFTFMRAVKRAELPKGREWIDLSLVGIALLMIANAAVVFAELWVPSGFAALVVAVGPFWVIGIERLTTNTERLGIRAIAGLLLGLAGLALLLGPGIFGEKLQTGYLLGLVVLQVGCLSWSAGSVYAKHRKFRVSSLMGASIQMLIAGALLTITGTLLGEWSRFTLNGRGAWSLAYLIVFGSIIGFSAYNYAVQKLPLSLLSTYTYVNPVIAVLLGWLFLQEPLGWRVVAATCVTLGGVAIVKSGTGRTAKRPAGQPPGIESEACVGTAQAEVASTLAR